MPRDLNAERPSKPSQLSESPERQDDAAGTDLGDSVLQGGSQVGLHISERDKLKPYVRALTLADVESCVHLEIDAFPEQFRCSREKFIYRLTKCAELSLGMFSTAHPDSPIAQAATAHYATAADSSSPNDREVLLAHVVATKCDSDVVTDEAMDIPHHGATAGSGGASCAGHREEGRTIALHSLAVLSEFQAKGLGTTILKSYLQRMGPSGIADRVALLCEKELVKFYEEAGFEDKGRSKARFGGGDWNDMVFELAKVKS
ncbi:MAG: hypothetical protein M1833_004585 [Piccolia ochrophora]|nr:MAG: hypothetical protein M1833_004585 [Piccolia ochrophora]